MARIFDVIGGDAGCNPCTTAAFAPDVLRLIVAGADGRAQVWGPRLSDSSPPTTLAAIDHGAPIARAFLTSGGATAVTVGDDGAARLWHAETGAVLGIIRGHGDLIADAALAPDGDTLLVADMSGGLRLSRISHHVILGTLEPPGWLRGGFGTAIAKATNLFQAIAASITSPTQLTDNASLVHQGDGSPQKQQVKLMIFVHNSGLTQTQAQDAAEKLRSANVATEIIVHRNPDPPDALFIKETAPVDAVREVLASLSYRPSYIFPIDYPTGGELDSFDVSIGLHSTHRYDQATAERELPYEIVGNDLQRLVEHGITQSEFSQRLRSLAPSRVR